MMREFFEVMGVLVGSFVILFGGLFATIYVGDSWSCAGYQEATGKPTKYVKAECYISDGGQWYSWTEYKNRLVTKGQMLK